MLSTRFPVGPVPFGFVIVGLVLESVLLGLSSLQLYFYFQRTSHNRWWSGFFMAFLWVLDCTHIALCVHAVHHWLLARCHKPLTVLILLWSIVVQANIIAVLAVATQILFARRSHKVRASSGLGAFIMFTSIGVFSTTFYLVSSKSKLADEFRLFQDSLNANNASAFLFPMMR